jgi:predicted RNase H-like nuclease (RuvC/YqgF family)
MSPTNTPLTLDGLAEAVRVQGEAFDRRLEALAAQGEITDRRIATVAGQVEMVTVLIQDLGRIVVRHEDELVEQRRQIRQILHRLEQHDAWFEEHSRRMEEHSRRLEEQGRRIDEQARIIRQILELWERRWGGDGGRAA